MKTTAQANSKKHTRKRGMNSREKQLLTKLERLELELARFKKRDTIFIDAVSEIMATAYRKSDQKIENILAGCISEIQNL